MNEQELRKQIVTTARACLGVRWRHQGRDPATGIDCAGLLIHVAHRLQLSQFDTHDYGHYPDGMTMQALLDAHMARIAIDEIQQGDVILSADSERGKWTCHIGIIVPYQSGGLAVIHATAQKRKVVENRLDASELAKVRAAYRFWELSPIPQSREVA